MYLYHSKAAKSQEGGVPLSDACLQKEVRKLKEADKDGTQTIIVSTFACPPFKVASKPFRLSSSSSLSLSSSLLQDAGQKHFGAVACSVCGMLYSAANPEDESQHLLFHNKFISAVKYVVRKSFLQ